MSQRFTTFTIKISRLNKLIQKLKADGMGQFGLKGVDTLCLYQLAEHTSMTFSEIAERCDLDGALVSRTLRSLVAKGMVEKDGAPGKYHARYSLTEPGRVQTDEIIRIIHTIQSQADEGISHEDLTVFYRVLLRLTDNFEKMAAAPQTALAQHQSIHQEES